jgi:hypothetical protein
VSRLVGDVPDAEALPTGIGVTRLPGRCELRDRFEERDRVRALPRPHLESRRGVLRGDLGGGCI